MTVSAILVIYKHDHVQLENLLGALVGQVGFVVLCNNNENDVVLSPHLLRTRQIVVLNFGINLGIAAAQNLGVLEARRQRAQFVVFFDQDSIVASNFIATLVSSFSFLSRFYSVGLVGPLDIDPKSLAKRFPLFRRKYVVGSFMRDVEMTLSSGSLVPLRVFDQIGGFDERLFIDCVDFEFCWRVTRKKYKIFVNDSLLMPHALGAGNLQVLNRQFTLSSPFRYYYQFRNVVFLSIYGKAPILWSMKNIVKISIKLFTYPFLPQLGLKTLRFMLIGIVHGLFKRMGKL